MRVLTSEQMKSVEQHAAMFGLSYQRMMENAGAACARNIRNILEREKIQGKKVIVVCGKGNNGGDGFVIARKFAENGYNVAILLVSGYPSSAEATYMYKMALDLSIPTIWLDADKEKALRAIHSADIIVDAVFGFSFYGNLSDEMAQLFAEMNNASGVRFSVDLPSGVYCDSGYFAKGCFKADYTVAISSLKPAHIMHPACDYCGDIVIASIGIPEESYTVVHDSAYTYDRNDVKSLFPVRETTSHKGTFGHLLCICGSKNMPGAAVMCTGAALRSGVGLVTVAFPESAYIPISSKVTEALLMPLIENEEGTLSVGCIRELEKNIHKYDAIVIGCGLGLNDDTRAVVEWVVENARVPVIVDADGINAIASNIDILERAKCKLVFTPHPKEMSRLTGADIQQILSNPVGYALDFSHKYGVLTVLKSANTIVTAYDSKGVYVNSTGNNGLSKGGSGDVLAGIMGAFAAQSFNLKDAVTSAVYVHGYAADVVADKYSGIGMLPSDVIAELKTVYKAFER